MRRINPNIAELLARHGRSIDDFAERSGAARYTIFALMSWRQHPKYCCGKGTIAWKIAQVILEETTLGALWNSC